MGKMKLTEVGVKVGPVSVKTQYVDGNREVVRRVLTSLEDKRVLWRGHENLEDPDFCRLSMMKTRDLLNQEILNVKHGGDIEASFKKIRRAASNFCTAAGMDSVNFRNPQDFTQALVALRTTVIRECVFLAKNFDLELEEGLVRTLPQQDLSFIPGFTNFGDLGRDAEGMVG